MWNNKCALWPPYIIPDSSPKKISWHKKYYLGMKNIYWAHLFILSEKYSCAINILPNQIWQHLLLDFLSTLTPTHQHHPPITTFQSMLLDLCQSLSSHISRYFQLLAQYMRAFWFIHFVMEWGLSLRCWRGIWGGRLMFVFFWIWSSPPFSFDP